MEAVLVLNANFEPINVCDFRRAIGMMITDKAILVLNGRGEIHTSSRTYPNPSIIRLQTMVHRPRPRVALGRREILRRDNYTCQYCGKHTVDLTIDHVIPRHLGGEHSWENVVAACPVCNHRKGGRRLEDGNMHLQRTPRTPTTTALYIFGRFINNYDEWEPFLKDW